ncbi:MAG: DUF4384 domain-containing protein [Bacteroidales bacterium]|nr:DUF4384 domain-containing protein [Bacteroidales bacterium]
MKKETINTNPEIFISYSRKDSKSVHVIINWLQHNGISSTTFFFDQDNIDGAGVFPTVIANAIKKCKVLIFFASKTSAESTWVKNEVFYALKNKKAVLPIFLEEVELEGEFDISLSRIQQLNLYENNKEKRYKAILSSLIALGITVTKSPIPVNSVQPNSESLLFVFLKKHKFPIIITLILASLIVGYFIFWPGLYKNENNTPDLLKNKIVPSENNEQLNADRDEDISINTELSNTLITEDTLSLYYSFHIKKRNRLNEIFDGGTVYTGDKMQVRVKVSKDCYLYILNQDVGKNIYVLFPIDDASNFLTGNKEVVIPADNKYFEADNQIGTEKLYIIASTKPMEFVNELILQYQSSPINQRGVFNINEKIENRGFTKVVEGNGLAIKNLTKSSTGFDLDRYLKGKEILFKEISFIHR